MGQHGGASGSILLGLDGLEVTAAEVVDEEWRLVVQTAATTVSCAACGSQARLHARRTVQVRDLPIGGRPVVLCWRKRIWRCGEPACGVQTWTEQQAAIRPRAVLTERARAEAAGAALQHLYRWADGVGVAELSRLARTVRAWDAEILAFHATGGCSNGSTEAVNWLIKKVKRAGHGFGNFPNYRLRLLLHCGVSWQTHQTASLPGRSPRLVA